MKKIFSVKNLHILTILLIAIQPVIDLDYLWYDFLNQYGLPRFATIVRFIIIPALVIWSFAARERKKKKVFLFAFCYGLLFLLYFYLHNRQSVALFPRLQLTKNFHYSTFEELTYVLTLALPYGAAYLFGHERFDHEEVKKIVFFLSAVISIPILIGDLFVFAKSTYEGYTVANFFSWFSGIYNWYKPRQLASKFFFNEGNTIGILLFMILPMLYYYFATEKGKDKKISAVLILIQSISMQCLATRVATYGAVVVPAGYLILVFIDSRWFSRKKMQKSFAAFCVSCAAFLGICLNWTPAVQNQKVDAINDTALLHNGMAALGLEELKNAEDLVPGTPEYINFYVYMFEAYGINARYIQSVPSVYYTTYYNYQEDPKFWVDVTFMPVFDRVNGRQIETIFFNYKYQNLTRAEKVLGMGYSTFMNGSIVLEKDFVQQIYTLGYAGEVLLVLPWIFVVLYGIIMFFRYRKKMFNLENVTLAVSLAAGLGSAYLSGHVLDQFLTTIFMAFITGLLLNRVHDAKENA